MSRLPASLTALLAGALVVAGCAAATTPATSTAAGATASATPSLAPGDDVTVPPDGVAVSFPTADGLTLQGRRFGEGATFVVLAHMKPASMESWFPFAVVLADHGYSALAFDFRGYGNSEGEGFAVDVDTIAAIDEATRLGAETVYAIGASMGGTGAIAAAAERPVAGVATLSAPTRFQGVDAAGAAARVLAPMLLVAAAGNDGYVAQAKEIARHAAGDAQVVALSGSRHGTDMFRDHGGELTDLLLGFLER